MVMIMKSLSSLIVLAILFSGAADSAESLKYARINYSPIQDVGERLLTVVYQRAGIEMEIVPLPAKRAAYEVGSGYKDGELMRIESYQADKTNLYKIPYPLGYVTTQLYVHKGLIDFNLDALSSYRLAVVKGIRHTNEFASQYPNVHLFDEVSLLFKQLHRGKVDVGVVSMINAQYELQKKENSDIVPFGEPIQIQPCYHYINVRHTQVIEKIEGVMKEMTDSGELQALWLQYVKELGNEQTFTEL